MIEPLLYFWLLLKASLVSTGGSGNLPSLHGDLLARGWASERQFAESLAFTRKVGSRWTLEKGHVSIGRGSLDEDLRAVADQSRQRAIPALNRCRPASSGRR